MIVQTGLGVQDERGGTSHSVIRPQTACWTGKGRSRLGANTPPAIKFELFADRGDGYSRIAVSSGAEIDRS